jgi:N6-adenosine-specific RNA methylase IME4
MSTKLPQYYSAAKQALAACVRKDEVKDIRDKATAMRMYAIQAKDQQLAADATEIQMRATRQIGVMMDEDRKAGRLAKGGEQYRSKGTGASKAPVVRTLEKQGIDKHLAQRARKAAKTDEATFERQMVRAKRIATAAASGVSEAIKEVKAERHAEKLAARAAREAALAGKIIALPQRRYGVIYADPEWHFETYSVEGTLGTSAQDHYPTSDLETIKARDVPSISADDAVLFLWATQPMLPHALEVMAAWGFEYKSHAIWAKDKTGHGYWFFNKHEVLLVGTRGKIPAPAAGTQWPSVIEAPRGAHSEKPAIFYELIEHYFPSLPKIELNARKRRAGWDSWGNEVPEIEEAVE